MDWDHNINTQRILSNCITFIFVINWEIYFSLCRRFLPHSLTVRFHCAFYLFTRCCCRFLLLFFTLWIFSLYFFARFIFAVPCDAIRDFHYDSFAFASAISQFMLQCAFHMLTAAFHSKHITISALLFHSLSFNCIIMICEMKLTECFSVAAYIVNVVASHQPRWEPKREQKK